MPDQPPVPAKDRVRSDDAGHLHQRAPAKLLAAHRESTALGVCEPERSRIKLFAKDAILLSEIVDQIFLVTIHPASNGKHEELQRRGHCERLLGRKGWHRIGGGDSPGLGRFFAPYGVAGIATRDQLQLERALFLTNAGVYAKPPEGQPSSSLLAERASVLMTQEQGQWLKGRQDAKHEVPGKK